jgi:hypothetical protein
LAPGNVLRARWRARHCLLACLSFVLCLPSDPLNVRLNITGGCTLLLVCFASFEALLLLDIVSGLLLKICRTLGRCHANAFLISARPAAAVANWAAAFTALAAFADSLMRAAESRFAGLGEASSALQRWVKDARRRVGGEARMALGTAVASRATTLAVLMRAASKGGACCRWTLALII